MYTYTNTLYYIMSYYICNIFHTIPAFPGYTIYTYICIYIYMYIYIYIDI